MKNQPSIQGTWNSTFTTCESWRPKNKPLALVPSQCTPDTMAYKTFWEWAPVYLFSSQTISLPPLPPALPTLVIMYFFQFLEHSLASGPSHVLFPLSGSYSPPPFPIHLANFPHSCHVSTYMFLPAGNSPWVSRLVSLLELLFLLGYFSYWMVITRLTSVSPPRT